MLRVEPIPKSKNNHRLILNIKQIPDIKHVFSPLYIELFIITLQKINRFVAQSILHINLRYFKKLYIAIGLIVSALIIGIVGFMWIEDYNLIDAVFMTIITIATVGYREVKELNTEGKIFTSFLIIYSISTFAYAISVITRICDRRRIPNLFQTLSSEQRNSKTQRTCYRLWLW